MLRRAVRRRTAPSAKVRTNRYRILVSPTCLEELPDDILLMLIRYLDCRTVIALTSLSRRFRSIVNWSIYGHLHFPFAPASLNRTDVVALCGAVRPIPWLAPTLILRHEAPVTAVRQLSSSLIATACGSSRAAAVRLWTLSNRCASSPGRRLDRETGFAPESPIPSRLLIPRLDHAVSLLEAVSLLFLRALYLTQALRRLRAGGRML